MLIEKIRQHHSKWIAVLALVAIIAHVVLRYGFSVEQRVFDFPLLAALVIGGLQIIIELMIRMRHGELGSDMLAGISIATAFAMGEHLAGTIVVLMYTGGEVIESYAVRSASSVLEALARRMPSVAHRRDGARIEDVALDVIAPEDELTVFPHEICPVDGIVVEGRGAMDEAYLTGEPFRMEKTPGSDVMSGSINGESALVIRATKRAVDSRYAKIVEVMRESERNRPRMRRLGDKLGAWYTPIALVIACAAWAISGEARRFLAVLVVATPCPLLIGIPVAIIGAISLSARRGIIVKDAGALERVGTCRTVIFDKTGTLTYGEPELTEVLCAPGIERGLVLRLAAGVERYSKHPLALAIVDAARKDGISDVEASEISERPGEGLVGIVDARRVNITSRGALIARGIVSATDIPPIGGGLECAVAIDGAYAAMLRFRDSPRHEGESFVRHLGPRHQFRRAMIVSGDRESEVRYLADQVGIVEIQAEKSPEDKLVIVRAETERANTLYIGDGINDAPALMAATVGIAMGTKSDITSAAAGIVIMETTLKKVDEILHISGRMKAIALQSALGGMALSIGGMGFAAAGVLTPVAGAIFQEIIDLFAVLNALRAAMPPKTLSDF